MTTDESSFYKTKWQYQHFTYIVSHETICLSSDDVRRCICIVEKRFPLRDSAVAPFVAN